MTDLIVALDGPSNQYTLACDLIEYAAVRWFKVGPQLMCSYDWQEFTHLAKGFPDEIKIFLDLKLADTQDTVRESVRRFADAGISAVSTYTYYATLAALEVAHQNRIQIWQVEQLSDSYDKANAGYVTAYDIICPGFRARYWKDRSSSTYTTIVPGVRLNKNDDFHGHWNVTTCDEIIAVADYAVVGRPIWSADAPIATAKLYKEALL